MNVKIVCTCEKFVVTVRAGVGRPELDLLVQTYVLQLPAPVFRLVRVAEEGVNQTDGVRVSGFHHGPEGHRLPFNRPEVIARYDHSPARAAND
jgi:hypothetical protein